MTSIKDMTAIGLLSGVNESYEPFIHVTIEGTDEDRPIAIGQLTPAEARIHGLAFLEAAEAAETDALIMSGLVERLRDSEVLGRPDAERFAVNVIELLRAARAADDGNADGG